MKLCYIMMMIKQKKKAILMIIWPRARISSFKKDNFPLNVLFEVAHCWYCSFLKAYNICYIFTLGGAYSELAQIYSFYNLKMFAVIKFFVSYSSIIFYFQRLEFFYEVKNIVKSNMVASIYPFLHFLEVPYKWAS